MSPLFAADGTQSSVALPNNNVTRAELLATIEGVKPRSGSAMAALEALATTGPVTLTSVTDGAKTMAASSAGILAALEDRTTLTGTGAVDLTKRTTLLNAASGSFTLTLANGSYDGEEHFIIFVDQASTAIWTASGLVNFLNAVGFVMSAASNSLHIKWNSVKNKWAYVGGNCLLS